MARTLRTIELNNTIFPINQTVYDLMKDDPERIKRLTAWKENLKVRFPQAKSEIDKKIASLYVNTYDGCLSYVNIYNNENNILKEVNPAIITEISELLKEQEGDSEIIKLLKTTAREDEETYKAIIESWEAGVAGLIFASDSIKTFYLDYLPNTYITDHLKKEPVITLAELDQPKLKEIITDIFATLYSGFSSTEKQEDLNGFQKGINDNLDKLKKLIEDVRETKKPKEPEKPDIPQQPSKELTDLNNELQELYNYVDAVLEKQSQQPVYILTEEPEQLRTGGEKPNPNYQIFEQELINHPLIKDKIQERINKRKFSTPITINKDKPVGEPKPVDLPNDWKDKLTEREKLLEKVKELQKQLETSSAPTDKHPDYDDLKKERDKLLEDVKELKAKLEKQPDPAKPESEIIKENDALWKHVDNLTKIIEKITPNSKLTSASIPSSSDSTNQKS
jgi:hypothetical protein